MGLSPCGDGVTHRPSFPWHLGHLVSSRAASCSPSWPPASRPHSPRERTRTEHLCFSLCCFCLFLIYIYILKSLLLDCRRPCAVMRLFIYKICTGKELGSRPHPPRLAVPVQPEQRWKGNFSASQSGRGGERKGLRGIETSKDVSKYLQVPRQKKYIYSVVLGLEGIGLEAEPARGSVCYIDL